MKNLTFTLIFGCLLVLSSAVGVFAQNDEREKGMAFYNQGDYKQAVELLQKAVEAHEDDKESWLYLGMSQARLKNQSQAVKALQKADKIFARKKESPTEQMGVKVLAKPRPSYTDAARMNNTQGIIKIAVEFGEDGKVRGVFPYQMLPNGLTENAVAVAKKIKFEPPTKDGKPYATIALLSYSFAIY